MFVGVKTSTKGNWKYRGGLAQMVERVLSMHEVPGSMPGSSTLSFVFFSVKCVLVSKCLPKQLELKGGISSNGRARA